MKKRIGTAILAGLLALCLGACRAAAPDTDPARDLNGLTGKVVYNIGEGNVPDLVFRSVLNAAGLAYERSDAPVAGKVALNYVEEGAKLTGILESGRGHYGILGEPAVTAALNKVEGSELFLDLQEQYAKATGSAEQGYPQACLAVKTAFLDAHPGTAAAFLKALETGGDWAQNHPEAALAAVRAAGSVSVPAITADAVKRCNIVLKPAAEIKELCTGYFERFYAIEPKSIGGKVPDSAFYAASPTAGPEPGVTFRVAAPDGAPAFSLAELMDKGFSGAEFSVVAPKLIGETFLQSADMAILPTSAAANLYNKGKPLTMLAVTTYGNLFMIRK